MMQEGIYALLSTHSAVTALIGNRVYAAIAPDDLALYPCADYKCVGGSSEPTTDTPGVLRQRLELNAFATDYATAAQIRAALIAALNGWQTLLPDGTRILDAILLNPGTDFCSEQRIFRCLVEFYILFTLP